MSTFHFTGSNHGGEITGIDIQFKGARYKGLEKVIKWMLDRRIAQNDIKSIVITTLQKRARKECLTGR